MKSTDNFYLTIQLTKKAHNDAHKFASKQANSQKVKQVYLNTLAVYAVQDFLKWLGIETDLNAGDSWHPVVRCFNDVADLVIPNLGKLECRPVLPGETVISLPPEVTEDRIAYIGVQFQEQLNEVQLLGFYPTTDPQSPLETIEITSLQPIETLIDYIDRLESGLDFFLIIDDPVAVKFRERFNNEPLAEIVTQLERIYRTSDKCDRRHEYHDFLANYLNLPAGKAMAFRGDKTIADRENLDDSQTNDLQDLAEKLLEKLDEIWGDNNSDESVNDESATGIIILRKWLQNIENNLQDHWQTLESFLNEIQGNLIYRFASATRSRSADTENQNLTVTKVRKIILGDYPLALIVQCQQARDGKYDILVRLYPINEEQKYLPQAVQLIILDEYGEVFLEAESQTADNCIERELRYDSGEKFSIKVTLEDANFVENFAI